MLPERWYFVKTSSSQLKNFILDSGLVSRAVYTSAEKDAEEKKTTPEEILVSKGNISEDDLRRMQAYVLGVPFINLANEKIGFEVLSMIPEPIARTHNIIAYNKSDRELEVAMLDVEDLQAIEFIQKVSNMRYSSIKKHSKTNLVTLSNARVHLSAYSLRKKMAFLSLT